MNPIIRNILAVIAGMIAGSAVNIGILVLGDKIIPPPGGCDMFGMPQTEFMNCLKAAIPSFTAVNYLTPLLAHGIGTLIGAFTTAKIAANRNLIFALVIGAWFLYGGVTSVMELGGAMWFQVTDLVFAYIPMAWIGFKLSGK